MIGSIAIVMGFVAVQAIAFVALTQLGFSVDVDQGIDAWDACVLLGVQLVGIGVVLLLATVGLVTLPRLGVRGARSGAVVRGFVLLAPAGIVVVAPTIVMAAAQGNVLHEGLLLRDAVAFVALALGISLNEELWFRGLLVDRLGAAGRPWFTVVLASVLFGLPHLGADAASWLNAAAVTLAVAVPFVVVRLQLSSLWPMVAWHAVIDTWAFLHTASVIAEGEPSTGELVGSLVLPAIVAACYVVWFARTDRTELTR